VSKKYIFVNHKKKYKFRVPAIASEASVKDFCMFVKRYGRRGMVEVSIIKYSITKYADTLRSLEWVFANRLGFAMVECIFCEYSKNLRSYEPRSRCFIDIAISDIERFVLFLRSNWGNQSLELSLESIDD